MEHKPIYSPEDIQGLLTFYDMWMWDHPDICEMRIKNIQAYAQEQGYKITKNKGIYTVTK